MERYILLGDLHVGVKNSSRVYLSVALELAKEIIIYANSVGITKLIQVGDFFDNRKALTQDAIEVANAIMDMFSQYFDITYLIVGNHDTSKKDVLFPHSLSIFKKYPKVKIIERPHITDDGILMLPWLFSIDDLVPANICIGHFDINGATMNSSGTVSKNHLLNFSDFSKYKMTVSGHYHTPNTLYPHNVKYIGSPYQLTHNDAGSDRGFWEMDFDFEDNGLEFIRFDKYPHHYTITDKTTDIGNLEGGIVKLVFTESYGIDGDREIINNIRKLNPLSLIVKYANLSDNMTDSVVSEDVMVKEKIDILYDFYDKSEVPENINPALLKKITESLYKEMKNNE